MNQLTQLSYFINPVSPLQNTAIFSALKSDTSIFDKQGLTAKAITIFKESLPPAIISLQIFLRRLFSNRLKEAVWSDTDIHDALYLNSSAYKRKFGSRQTRLELNGLVQSLSLFHATVPQAQVSYSNFRSRIKSLISRNLVDRKSLENAAVLTRADWMTFHGGGRRKPFVYHGESFPELLGQSFSSRTAFLKTVDAYSRRDLVWNRLKHGWRLDDAICEPVIALGERAGLIYLATCKVTGEKYVGLTVMLLRQRWDRHVHVALVMHAGSCFAQAIRQYGPDAFELTILESNLRQKELAASEIFWIDKLQTLKPHGLNTLRGGQMGGGRGKQVTFGDRVFHSLEAAGDIISAETGLPPHVIKTRLREGKDLPERARTASKHPDAGGNLWRRWKSLLNATQSGARSGFVSSAWLDYERYKRDVELGYRVDLRLVRLDDKEPWGSGNFQWASRQQAVEKVHGKTYQLGEQLFGSLQSLSAHCRVSVSTLRYRIHKAGMTTEQAVSQVLGATSAAARSEPVIVDAQAFSSINKAARYAASAYNLTFDQARDRIRRGVPLTAPSKARRGDQPS